MQSEIFRRLAAGVIAGLAGTMVIKSMQAVGQRKMPEEMPPIKQDPGEYIVEKAEEMLPTEMKEKIPESVEKTAAEILGIGYGMTFGVLFEMMHRREHNLLLEGAVLGMATWASGYLGWLPATKLMPAITKQRPGQVAGAILSHIIYGISTAGTIRALKHSRLATHAPA